MNKTYRASVAFFIVAATMCTTLHAKLNCSSNIMSPEIARPMANAFKQGDQGNPEAANFNYR